jgi:DNA-binding HxlR family transcriptional regulator
MIEQTPPKPATLDTRALAEASRNLTQKLKQLSSEVLISRVDFAQIYIITEAGCSVYHYL